MICFIFFKTIIFNNLAVLHVGIKSNHNDVGAKKQAKTNTKAITYF